MSTSTKKAAQSLYEKSVRLIAEIAAIVISFFASGPLYSMSVDWVVGFAQRQYGEGFDPLIEIFWFIIVGLSTYAFARATVATLIIVGGTAIMVRIF